MSVYIGRNPIVNDGLILNCDASSPLNYTLSEVEVLIVAGGGGGGAYAAGAGGGAGGVVYNTNYAVTPGSAISVTVGNGGNGGVWSSPSPQNGQNSLFGKLTAVGGGAGGQGWGANPGSSGGSGGGGAGYDGVSTQNYVGGGGFTPGQGFSGGRGKGISGNRGAGGGGGGAGGPGGEATNFGAGNGGRGIPFNISGVMRYYGGGGGGGDYGSSGGGNGGVGGGGTQSGGNSSSQTATNGAANTGGGGGGSRSATPDSWNGGNGGSGVVIVRYRGPQKATGGNTITSTNGYTVHIFTSSGTFTPLNIPANAGTVYGLQDLSGQRNSGTLTNGPTYSSANGGSIVFDGSDDFADIIATTNTFSADFSVSGWYYATINTGGYRILFETNGYRQGTGGIAIYQFNDYFRIWKSTGTSSAELITTSAGTVGLNVWKQFVLTRSSGVLTFYLNSVSSGTYSTDTEDYYAKNLTGKYNLGGGRTIYFFKGNIAQVSIYNRALTAQEIQQNFNALRGRFGI